MEITIKAQCPNCEENLVFRHESAALVKGKKEDELNEEALMGDSFFNIIKRTTLNQNGSYNEPYKLAGNGLVRASVLPKSARLIQNYFDNLRAQIKATDEHGELLKISNKLAKAKAVVSKEVQQEIKKQKPRVLALIKNRVRELNKKKRKN